MNTREIKFRGRREADGEWVYGSLIITSNATNNPFQRTSYKERYQICQYDSGDWNMGGWSCYDVIPKTVGQFTGLKDKNGVDIYENDIVKFQEFKNLSWDEESFKLFSIEERKGELLDHYISKVYWEDSNFLFDASENCQCCLSVCFGNQIHQNPIMVFEVIGNIHDNPELLK